MTDEGRRFSDDEAAAALKRAAQLQLDAAERVEHAAELAPSDVAKDGGHAREDLVDAAAEAGIDARYMALALREQADGTAVATTSTPASDDVASRWLGTRRRTLRASRMFDAEGAVVLEACCRVFELPRFGLEMVGINHGHPLEGGVLEFLMPKMGEMAGLTGKYSPLAYRLHQLELWTLRVTFEQSGSRTKVVVEGDLRPGRRPNVRFSQWSTGIVGTLAGVGGTVLAGVAGLSLGVALLPGVAVAAVAGRGVTAGYHAIYSWVLKKTEGELGRLLDGVATDLTRQALNAPST